MDIARMTKRHWRIVEVALGRYLDLDGDGTWRSEYSGIGLALEYQRNGESVSVCVSLKMEVAEEAAHGGGCV
ncbi:unnamed protein product [Sphenostylis stenocarpa]|uniref:Uncharacterized protein n=1 Tax=Sphenostylis stenocarpa TaxID=92480 RepID=A0AA86SJB3_9FABA|nr:unnamed protein product [Sphenostylis stenocarpa]